MTDVALLRGFMDQENLIVAAARAGLDRFWAKAMAAGLKPEAVRDLLLLVYPALVGQWANASASHSADLYDELRAEAIPNGSRFTAYAQLGIGLDRLEQAVREAARHLWGPDPDKTRSALSDRLDRHVKQAGRDTMEFSARRDPSKPRFARVPLGETCAWCRMLAGRGFVYRTEESAGELSKFHTDCDCMIVPGWGADPRIGGHDPRTYEREWVEADRDLAAMRKGTPENASRGKPIPIDQQQELARLAQAILPDARLNGFNQIRDAEQTRRQLQTLEALLDKYPGQREKIKVLAYARLEDDFANWNGWKLVIDTSAIPDHPWIVPSGIDPATYVVTHEFGHILANGTKAEEQYRSYLEGLTGRSDSKALSEAHRMGLISEYATEKWCEALAEGFARMELSLGSTDAEVIAHMLLTGKGGSQ